MRCEESLSPAAKGTLAGREPKKSDPGESVWLAPFEPTRAVLIMAVAGETVKRLFDARPLG
jgi:hypothetical protein